MLAAMEADDAADLLGDLDQDRRRPVLRCCRGATSARSGRCSAYIPRPRAG